MKPSALSRALPAHVLAAAQRKPWGTPFPPPKPAKPKPAKRRGVMNATEALYAMELGAERSAFKIRWYQFEAIKLRLGNGAWYTPDFAVITADGSLEMHEVKGPIIREAAMVRLKVAASMYPFRFLLVQITKDGRSSRVIQP